MAQLPQKYARLSIDILPEQRRRIKAYAALHGMSIREYVLAGIQHYMRQEEELRDLAMMTREPTIVLKELWDNEKDSAYDKL